MRGMKEKDIKGIMSKKSDLSAWYSDVLLKAELADYAPTKGFMIIRPTAYAIWEQIQARFDAILKEKAVKNVYFPLLIPESFFKREAEHAKGFAPELAYVQETEEGERLAIRPTSETIMYDSFSKWIRSHRDLPLKLNQWCNVLRWEVKQTKPFLRTREFLWQEGHCAFATEREAEANMMEIILEYQTLCKELLALPVMIGRKSVSEKFAGAVKTMTIEGLMPDGKALQCGTSHNLGQGFAKAFNVWFKGEDAKEHLVWQTSWGISTRLIGAVVMVHGDDKGLVLPPRVAAQQAVIVPIYTESTKSEVVRRVRELEKQLKHVRCFVDEREGYSPGWKFNEWEVKGIPLRIELGPKDIEKKQVVIVRRDSGEKVIVGEKEVAKTTERLLGEIQDALYRKAEHTLRNKIIEGKRLKDVQAGLEKGLFVKAYLEDSVAAEKGLKEKTGANSRFIEDANREGICVITGKKVKTIGYIAKNY